MDLFITFFTSAISLIFANLTMKFFARRARGRVVGANDGRREDQEHNAQTSFLRTVIDLIVSILLGIVVFGCGFCLQSR